MFNLDFNTNVFIPYSTDLWKYVGITNIYTVICKPYRRRYTQAFFVVTQSILFLFMRLRISISCSFWALAKQIAYVHVNVSDSRPVKWL